PREGIIGHVDALRRLAGVMMAKGLALEFQQDGRLFPFDVIIKRVQKNGTWGRLSAANLDFNFGLAGAYGHGFVLIQEKTPGVAGCWNA
ncbi:hypothetical protein, partial [Ralstonia pseudosolanacearum]|uniref:hypothetical protein n=2 Tax=Ralstonia pseudosolanacearum TaxID=1310165 RepID=UPI003AAAECDC